MWAIMRATSIAPCVRDRVRARPCRTRCSGPSAARSRRRARRARSRRGGRATTAGSACRRASRRSPRTARSIPSSRSSARCTSARSRTVNSGKSEPVRLARRRVDRRRPGRALAAAEQVRADDAEAVGVDQPAGPDQRVPPVDGLGVAGQRVADVDDRVRRIAVAAYAISSGASCAPDSRTEPSGRTSVSTTRAPGGDDAGVKARQVQTAVEARVLDLHAAVGDDVEARGRARSRPPRRSAGRAASRTCPRPLRPPRAPPAGAGRRGGRRRRCPARPAGRPATGST